MTVVSHLYVWYDTPRSGVYGAVSLSRYVMSRISGQDKLSVGPDKISIWLSSFLFVRPGFLCAGSRIQRGRPDRRWANKARKAKFQAWKTERRDGVWARRAASSIPTAFAKDIVWQLIIFSFNCR